MCMLDEIHKLSHAKDQFTYYHSMEEEKEASYIKGYDVGEKNGLSIGRNEGISIGRNVGREEGREEAYMEMAKAFGIPYEEIKAKTKSLKKK